LNILVIDDNVGITDMLYKFLTVKKHKCTVLNDPKKSVKMIQQKKFDVVILDLAMPEFTGLDAIDSLNELDRSKIIVLTATIIDNKLMDEMKSKGVTKILQKPISNDKLLNVIEG
tara:strand:- start:196 stop:540 length:345 start_codon:yes stop_codon:yes gene_type:complete